MKKRYPSIKDVAQVCGTSISTVSNVLNGKRGVSAQTRKKVLSVADSLDYVANPIARRMKRQRTDVVSVIVTDLNCLFFLPLLKGIEQTLSQSGYTLAIYETNCSPEREIECLRVQQSGLVDGIILATAIQCHTGILEQDTLRAEVKPVPIVSVETNLNKFGIDSVLIDNQQGAALATRHLIEQGSRQILHITGPLSMPQCRSRHQGYRAALQQAGIPYDGELVVDGALSSTGGCNAVGEALRKGMRFDGVFAANDQMAVGALNALRLAGLTAPEDVKVAGFDDTFVSSIVEPALTTIHIPHYEMGQIAARMLLDRISHPQRRVSATAVDFELKIRKSTNAAAGEPFCREMQE